MAEVIDCPGVSSRQFLPGQMEAAKRFVAGATCSKKNRCPSGQACEKNSFIVQRKYYIDATVKCICPLSKRALDEGGYRIEVDLSPPGKKGSKKGG